VEYITSSTSRASDIQADEVAATAQPLPKQFKNSDEQRSADSRDLAVYGISPIQLKPEFPSEGESRG
jgi:hypothetical protein